MDFSSGAYIIPDNFKNQVNFSYFCYDHFSVLSAKQEESFFNFEECDHLESIEKVKGKKDKKGKKGKKFKKLN